MSDDDSLNAVKRLVPAAVEDSSTGAVPVVDVVIGMVHPVAVAIIRARATLPISGISRPDAEHAFDAANNAADCAADHRPDRPRSVAADISAMGDAVRNALRLCRQRTAKRCCERGREEDASSHPITPFS
jgi:hypothetical protein